ncbi:MAG: HEAT repeat domain-containing protein [Candidatus Omnitrophota bacterium]
MFSADTQGITPNEFLDIEMNRARDFVFFNASEQKLLKENFLVKETIDATKETALKKGNKWRRIEAILLLGYVGTGEVLAVLAKTALHRDEDIAYFSVKALAQTKTMESVKLLTEIFIVKKNLRQIIAASFDGLSSRVADIFIELVNKEDPSLKIWALNLASKVGSSGHMNIIKKLTMDPVDEVRAAACECLGKIGGKDAVTYIEKRLVDKSWFVRAHAVIALSELLGAASLAKMMSLINDSSLTVIESVKNALENNIEEALPYLKDIFKGNDDLAKKVAMEALEGSGHLEVIIRGAFKGKGVKQKQYEDILKDVLSSGVYTGLISLIARFDDNEKANFLNKLRSINYAASEELKNFILGKK